MIVARNRSCRSGSQASCSGCSPAVWFTGREEGAESAACRVSSLRSSGGISSRRRSVDMTAPFFLQSARTQFVVLSDMRLRSAIPKSERSHSDWAEANSPQRIIFRSPSMRATLRLATNQMRDKFQTRCLTLMIPSRHALVQSNSGPAWSPTVPSDAKLHMIRVYASQRLNLRR